MTARELYRQMCSYLEACGWNREEPGSGWWYDPQGSMRTIGDAVEECLVALDYIDVRADP